MHFDRANHEFNSIDGSFHRSAIFIRLGFISFSSNLVIINLISLYCEMGIYLVFGILVVKDCLFVGMVWLCYGSNNDSYSKDD